MNAKHSALYVGSVQHRRELKARHHFNYPLFMVYLDLDEIKTVMPRGWLWNLHKPAMVSYWRNNYLPSSERNLATAVRLLVKQRSGHYPTGPIRMLTHLSYFGYCFNPATLFYCFHPDGKTLDCVVIEITNTPWKERYAYVLTENLGTPKRHHYKKEKVFHVSPFFELDHDYDWYLTTPKKYLSLYIRNTRAGERVFDATLSLKREPLTPKHLLKTLAKFPFMTAQVWAGIHWEATKLLVKNVGYYNHPLDYKKEKVHTMSPMTPSIAHDITWLENKRYPEMFTSLFRDAMLKKMQDIETGCVIMEDRNNRYVLGDIQSELKTTIRVHNRQFYPLLVLRGSLGAAESYIKGYWSSDDLVTVFRVLLRNLDTLTGLEKGMARLMKPVQKIHYALKANSLKGSKKNILSHYDLSNDFYKLFLDEGMTYSAGIFNTPETTLEEAQHEKLDRLCRKLDLKPEDRILEIGSGWGSLALHAATHYGCHVTTTTISDAQYELAKERIETAGLNDRITLLKKDYRHLEGQYDKLVSIEMIEAVGHKYISTYFQHCSRLLKPDGIMAIQGITLADQHFDTYMNTIDFIKKYVFPGGCLISQEHILRVLKSKTDLRVVHLEDIALDYAKTLQIWRGRFFENVDKIKNLGFSEAFIRLWEFYLTYCEGGFREQYIGDIQMVLAKSGNVNLKMKT